MTQKMHCKTKSHAGTPQRHEKMILCEQCVLLLNIICANAVSATQVPEYNWIKLNYVTSLLHLYAY